MLASFKFYLWQPKSNSFIHAIYIYAMHKVKSMCHGMTTFADHIGEVIKLFAR